MGFFLTIRVALRALRKNKLRAGLTVLGVVIGIAAVTTMVSIGQSAGALVQGQLQGLGTNVLLIFPGSNKNSGARVTTVQTLTAKDSDAIAVECPAVLAASPMVGASGQVIFGSVNWNPGQMYGVGPDYLTVRNWALEAGDFFSERDITSASRVCVIGHTLVPKLFQTSNPLGQMVRIKNIPMLVIGVLEKRGADMVGRDQDDIVLIPVTERTREIGIRMAVGARPRDILRQFLVEAVVLSAIGGAVGLALGMGASVGATYLINWVSSGAPWPVVVSVPAALIAMVFAAAVGLVFGYYPARRASRLD